jgi:flavodoxin
MKPSEILLEQLNPQLLQYVSNADGISRPADNLAVFVWTNKALATLLKHGLNSGQELQYISTPEKNQAGLGIINLGTNQAAVGAIDRDGGVFVVSSLDDENTDATAFMRTVRNPKVRKLFSRLENLEDLFAALERSKKKSKGSSGEFYQDLLDANSELDDPVDENLLDLDTEDPVEAKRELEQKIKDLEKELKDKIRQKEKIISAVNAGKISADEKPTYIKKYSSLIDDSLSLESLIEGIKQLIKDNPDLFKLRKTVEKDDDDIQDDDDQINQWLDQLLDDFPELKVKNAQIFNPNPETIGG